MNCAVTEWFDWVERTDCRSKFLEFYKSAKEKHVTSNCLTIGAGNCNYEACMTDNVFRKLKNLYIVDPYLDLLNIGVDKLKSKPISYEIHSFAETVDRYNHKGEKLDLILLLHCAYWLMKDLDLLLTRLKSWLTEDGEIVIVHDSGIVDIALSATLSDIKTDSFDNVIDKEVICRAVEKSGLQYELTIQDFTLDIGVRKICDYQWVNFLINRKLKNHEIEPVTKMIEKLRTPGTDTIQLKQFIYRLTKEKK